MSSLFQLKSLVRLCAVAACTTAAAGTAMAQTVPAAVTRGAVAVTSPMGQFDTFHPLSKLFNQSGLSSAYVNGATAFSSFVSNSSHNSLNYENSWVSRDGVSTGLLSFDLGSAYSISGLAWFGLNPGDEGLVTAIKVFSDNDNDVTNGNTGLLFDSGGFAVPSGSTSSAMKPNVFTFSSAASTRYINIQIVSVDFGYFASVGEVVFRQNVSAVPEPGTYALMALGLLAIGLVQRRRMARL